MLATQWLTTMDTSYHANLFGFQRERELLGICPPQLFWMQGEVTCHFMDAGEVAAPSCNLAATHTFRQKCHQCCYRKSQVISFFKIKETHYRKQYVPVIWEPCNQNHLNLFAYLDEHIKIVWKQCISGFKRHPCWF